MMNEDGIRLPDGFIPPSGSSKMMTRSSIFSLISTASTFQIIPQSIALDFPHANYTTFHIKNLEQGLTEEFV